MRISDWSSDVCSSDLLVLQTLEAVWQPQVLQGPRARYCTYFIYTIITYCTVLLRNPKRAVRRGFRPCFGFRRRARSIPKKGFLAFFGFVVRTLLWITWRRPAMPRHALRQHLQAGRRSEEHTSELQAIMSISYAVFRLEKKSPIN